MGTEYPKYTMAQPGFDYSPDAGAYCFVTGQHIAGHSNPGENDVDGGPVRLVSPVISVNALDAEVSYARWFYSVNGNPDELTVELSRDNGESWVLVETVTATDGWERHSFRLSEFPEVTGDELRVRFTTADEVDATGRSLTEAAIDEFHVRAIRCEVSKGDFNGDDRIDLADYGHLPDCLAGPGAGYDSHGCAVFDFDDDGDVDVDDYAAFQSLFGT